MKDSFLKLLLDAHIAPVLAEHGFKRKKSTWNRRIDGVVHVVHFQVSKGHTPGKWEQFTIEVGVTVDVVEEALEGKLPRFFDDRHCITIARVGSLSAVGFDKWWDLKSERDVPAVTADVVHDLCTYCLPVLDRINSLQSVKDFIMKVDSYRPKAPMLPYVKLGLAALCYIMGDREEYEKLKDDLIHGKGKGPRYDPALDPWPKRMTEVAARLEADDSASVKHAV